MKSLYLIKPYLSERRLSIVLGLVFLITVDFLQLFIPRIIKWAIDDLTGYRINKISLLIYALYIIGISILIGIFRYLWRRCLLGTSRRVEEGLRNRLFSHIQTLSASYFDKAKTGDLMAHATNDIQNVRMATGMGMVALTDAVVLGTAAVGFMVYINLKLTLFVLIPMPLIVFGARFFSKKMHRGYEEVQGAFSELTEIVRERFAGIRMIKAYNREQEALSRIESISKDYVKKNLALVRITGSFSPLMVLFSNISLSIVLFLGGRQTIMFTITPGDFVAFISYLGLLTWPMMATGWVTNLIQRGKASLNRIDRIIQEKPSVDDPPDPVVLHHVKGSIAFEAVAFSYRPFDHSSVAAPVLDRIHLKIKQGGVLGIVGAPGSGKSTLLTLIPRTYDVSDGCITLDGTDIRKIQLSHLRSMISYMPQEPFLFAGTIRENITFDSQKTNESKLIQAVERASLSDILSTFPNGFETIVGEKGIVLSGGQKQRVGLARMLLKDAPVMILDDPISQVDLKTGEAIVDTIRSMAGEKTIIIVSHRLSAVRFADRIITLDHGRIAESGTHAQLMENNQYYAKTFRLQEVEEEYA
jgi:ATP-binding cassette, subfamily B, multidrug efflux pump